MIKNNFIIILFSFFALTLIKCNGGGNGKDPLDGLDSIMNEEDKVVVSEAEIDEIIQSLPSPAEMAALIESLGVPFSRNYLASPEKADDYDSNFKKALGLGILSADLGYLNVYAQTNESVNYLATIRRISDDLNVGQFFDFQTLKRLASSNENMDSLMFLSQNSFREMDTHLRKNNRSNLSALVVTGVWMESMYFLTQIVRDGADNKDLTDRIGEQKVILEMLNKVLQVYKVQDKNFKELAGFFDELSAAYEQIEIIVEPGPVTTVMIDGIEVVTTKDKSIVTMSENQLNTIINLIEKIRNKLISL
jgi:hypothetical protein